VLWAVTMKIYRLEETLKIEATNYFEVAINVDQNTWRQVPEDL
jgi:hypothetical protein